MAGKGQARLGVDIGGTFTDVVLEVRGERHSAKVLTTPEAPERAVIDAVRTVLREAGLQPRDLSIIIHGTTLATNAIIERKGAQTALVTTEGFRDTVEIRHEKRSARAGGGLERLKMAIAGPILLPGIHGSGPAGHIDAAPPAAQSGPRQTT